MRCTALLLLAGLAIGAIANAGIGLLVFVADDRQLRDVTFWMLGSLSGATWPKAATLAAVLTAALIGGTLLSGVMVLMAVMRLKNRHAAYVLLATWFRYIIAAFHDIASTSIGRSVRRTFGGVIGRLP